MLPSFVKTEIWRELIDGLCQQLHVPVMCEQAVFGRLPYFQQLRNRKSDDPLAPAPGVKYVRVHVGEHILVVGPFKTNEPHAFDEELAEARKGLPEWREEYEPFSKLFVRQAVLAGKRAFAMEDALMRAKLLLEFSKEVGHVQSVDAAMTAAVQFLVHKFKANNVVLQVAGKRACQFDVAPAAEQVVQRVVKEVRDNKIPYVAKSVSDDVLLKGIEGLGELPRCVVALPLVKDREYLGTMVMFAEHMPFVDGLSEVLNELLLLLMRLSKYEQVEQSAKTDALTGLLNRAAVSGKIEEILRESASQGKPLSVLMADVDNFKQFNDAHGHPEGDKLLKQVASTLKAVAPVGSMCCRYGGEEFMLVLPGADQNAAKETAERFRAAVQGNCPTTVSVGVMSCLNSSASWPLMVKEADRALYKAKHVGKNRVVAFVMVDKGLGVIDG